MGYLFSLSKAGSEVSLAWSEIALLVFGALLVAGLIGEYRTADKSKWYKRFEMFVILGVLGELLADGGIFLFTSHLEALNAIEVAALNKEAGEARKTASEIASQYKDVDLAIADANARAKAAEAQIAIASAQAAEANERAAKLEAAQSWRVFSPKQAAALTALIKGCPPIATASLLFDSVVGNPEAKRYGDQISAALSKAGVSSPLSLGLSTCLECTGVWVCVNQSARPELMNIAGTLRGFLERTGVTVAKFCLDPKNDAALTDKIRIIVGPKQ